MHETSKRTPDERADMIERLSSDKARQLLAYLAGYSPGQFDELIAYACEHGSPLRDALGGGSDE